jgi:hypothetical protein
MKDDRKETVPCQATTAAENHEVLKEQATMQTGKAESKRHLATGRHRKRKDEVGCRSQESVRRARLMWRKGIAIREIGPGPRLNEQPAE